MFIDVAPEISLSQDGIIFFLGGGNSQVFRGFFWFFLVFFSEINQKVFFLVFSVFFLVFGVLFFVMFLIFLKISYCTHRRSARHRQ